jgi:hypothetical protein
MNRNITLALDERTLAQARILAARQGLSVSALLRQEIQRLAEESEAYDRAREAALRRLARGVSLGGGPYPDREEVHRRD